MNTALGPASLLFSNFMLIIVLVGVRWLAPTPMASVGLFAVANLICATMIFFPRLTGRRTAPWDRKSIISLMAWAICYAVNYGLYALYPEAISLSDLIIAESLAPTAAVILSGDWRAEKARTQKLAANFGGVSLLLLLAYLKRDHQASGSPVLIFVSMLCFLGTNVAARNVAKLGPALWGQARVSALNGILLTLFILSTRKFAELKQVQSGVATGLAFAVGLTATQGSFLFGISRTSPFLSALLISTSVPLSLFSDAILHGQPLISIEGGLGLLYCVFVWLTQKWFARNTQDTKANLATAS